MVDRKMTAVCPGSFLEMLVYMTVDEVHYRDATEAGQTRCLDCRHSSKKGGQVWCREIGRRVRERGEDIKGFPVGPGKTCDEAKPKTKRKQNDTSNQVPGQDQAGDGEVPGDHP